VCLNPEADEDTDGIINRIEAALGTNPGLADSDGDGRPDAAEIGDVANATDTDGDGKIDARESAMNDVDHDCIADEVDKSDAFSNLPSTEFSNACGDGKPLPGDKPGGAAECDALKSALGGTCAAAFGAAFGDCFDPDGCITPENLPDGTSRLRWENARTSTNAPTPSASACTHRAGSSVPRRRPRTTAKRRRRSPTSSMARPTRCTSTALARTST